MRLAVWVGVFNVLLVIVCLSIPDLRLRRVTVGAAKLQDQVGVGALVEDGVFATRVARRVGVGAVASGARRAGDAVAVTGRAGEELEALALEGVTENGGQVVVCTAGVGGLVVDGLERAAEIGLAGDGERGLLHVRARDSSAEGVVLVGLKGDDPAGTVALLGLEVEREVALVVDEDLGGRGRGGEAKAGEHNSGEVHVGGDVVWLVVVEVG